MRILCVTAYYKPAFVYGGPIGCIAALCEGLAKIGDDVTVFTTNANGSNTLDVSIDEGIIVDGVKVHYFPVSYRIFKRFPFYFYSPALARACAEVTSKFDLVYTPGNWTDPFKAGAMASVRNCVPFVITPHGNFMDWSMQQKGTKKRLYLELVERRLINQAAAIHVTTEMEATQIRKWHFTPQIVTIPNGINLGPYRNLPERGKMRQSLGLCSDDQVSLYSGRLHQMKRPRLMMEAFAMVAAINPKTHFLIIGPDQDDSRKEMDEAARRSGLAERVHFTGLLDKDEVLQAYADADLLVLLSHRENFGMVLVEGMAAGLPVLVSEEVGLANDIQECGAGVVVTATLENVSREWSRLIDNPALRQQLGKNGRRLVEERFSDEIVVQQMRELFRSVIGQREKA